METINMIPDIPPTAAFSNRSSSFDEKIYPIKAKNAIMQIAIIITFSILFFINRCTPKTHRHRNIYNYAHKLSPFLIHVFFYHAQ